MAKSKGKKKPEEIPPEILARLEELEARAKELGISHEELLWTHTLGTGLNDLKKRIEYLERWISRAGHGV
ncbi:MAG: hypothetical protein ABDI20_04405 [Candidatus Bipolaricaulaceae bacterium]